jgi:ribosomal protein L37AE/L43A
MQMQEADLADREQKFFACPECGKSYKVRFNGAGYQCRQCRSMFHVPGDGAETRSQDQTSLNRLVKFLLLMVALLFAANSVEAFLIVRFYRRVQPLVKTANEAVQFMKQLSDKFE